MIKIDNKFNCCGCWACFNICPQNAIEMEEDDFGFEYPKVDKQKCINCGLCKNVCPILNKKKTNNKPVAYACINTNEDVRMKSSSGGIFTLLAEKILELNGVVFGAEFDEKLNVVHSYIDEKKELYRFRGSKYVQSEIGNAYIKVKKFLESGRYVLFSGTPCQVEGLCSYLKKDYDKLYTQDIICHGVPSRKIWHKYIQNLEKKKKTKIVKMNFRDKNKGWLEYRLRFCGINKKEYYEINSKSTYMNLFLKDYIIRDSCYKCQFKSKNRKSDITLADFWGVQNINQNMFDNKGTSLVIINSQKGANLFEKIKQNIEYAETNLKDAIKYNQSMIKSPIKPENREKIFDELISNNNFDKIQKHIIKENIKEKWQKYKGIIKKINNIFK